MTDPLVPGGAGLPDPSLDTAEADQPQPADPIPGQIPAQPEAMADATSPWPVTDTPAQPGPAPIEGGAGFGMPAGPGFGTPPAGWTPGPALTPTTGRRGPRKRLLIVAAVVVAVAIGLYVFKDSLTGAPGDLKVGDCFDVPTVAAEADVVSSVQHHPCTESHTGEVFFITPYTGAATTYPAVSDFDQFANDACAPAFKTYVGTDLDSDPDLSAGYFYPPQDGWSSGDRTILCYATRAGDGVMTRSVKGSATAPGSTVPSGSATP